MAAKPSEHTFWSGFMELAYLMTFGHGDPATGGTNGR